MHLPTFSLLTTLVLMAPSSLLAAGWNTGGGGGTGSSGGGYGGGWYNGAMNAGNALSHMDPSKPYLNATWTFKIQNDVSVSLHSYAPYVKGATKVTFPFQLDFSSAHLYINITATNTSSSSGPSGRSTFRGTTLLGNKSVSADLIVVIEPPRTKAGAAWEEDPESTQDSPQGNAPPSNSGVSNDNFVSSSNDSVSSNDQSTDDQSSAPNGQSESNGKLQIN
ncbi:hypothetical protein BJ684DRAFT_18410 [Piptocephalis cylindrospora]|uniref:Uncharacterized protein n=1 Tax=Piptocephalis cylindrospora TaxID=1907219 RepID=A0A4P9Y8X6_9FUNG|nr:hypothetical protein BJ684DRAFT_18410 [Piptocephalis cylindrospora]|eukprot:RKP15242.1 hypothetical protein BJ684DRAFT_18410 [Piptocephalis cylindrospora]